MEPRKVKGTIMIDTVKMIRANKDRDWLKYLTPEDWTIVSSKILASRWYPLETFQRCGWATFKELAGGNLDLVRARGKFRGLQLFSDTYRIVFEGLAPAAAVDRFCSIYNNFFNFSTLAYERVSETHVRAVHDYDPDDRANVPYCHQLMGYFDALLEMAGAKKPLIRLLSRQWDGDPTTFFELTWS